MKARPWSCFYSVSQVYYNYNLSGATGLRIVIFRPSFFWDHTAIAVPPCHSLLFGLIKLKHSFLQIKRELVYILTSPLYKERYVITILMNLPHLSTSAYHPQDTALHIQGDYLLLKHLRRIQSMVLFSILLPLFRSLFVKRIRQKLLHQYSYKAYYMLRK